MTTTPKAKRPSHQLPRPIFDAILDLERAVRTEKDRYNDAFAGPESATTEQQDAYLGAVMQVGGLRDRLASLILGQADTTAVNVALVGTAQ